MKLRTPSRDTVLFPAVSYPSYAMGATLSGCRPVAVPMTASGGIDISKISADDAKRALMIWMNSPSNPTGALDDMEAVVKWGRANNIPVFSDECYVEFTWQGKPSTALQYGTEGVIALHSLSKRSNLAGLRVAFYAGDADIVHYLKEVRKHAGLMVPGPAQAAGVVALNDVEGVKVQAQVYRRRLERTAQVLSKWSGRTIDLPAGGFYLWFDATDGWEFAERLATEGGALVSPGDFYGAGGSNNVRVAVVQPDDRIELLAQRLGL
jgi:aspartate/methionine/tyrosine aminotransferase